MPQATNLKFLYEEVGALTAEVLFNRMGGP